MNLREQHDACEFYNILVESLNEALKALGHEQIMNKILGGSYSDQKICKTCPHRYITGSSLLDYWYMTTSTSLVSFKK